MSHKKYFFGLLGLYSLCIAGMLVLAYFIDPIGMWGAPVVRGFNHYKPKQPLFHDVWKPYEYMREKPEVVYIGTSQVLDGFKPIPEADGKKAYNMGLNGLTLPKMREYLRFIYKVHKPEIVYMDIHVTAFDKNNYAYRIPSYSEERLCNLAGPLWRKVWQFVKDSLGLHETYVTTVKESRTNKEMPAPFFHGWYVWEGDAKAVKPNTYYRRIWNLVERHEKGGWEYAPEAMECFRDIVREADAAGVKLVVFFPPNGVDRYAVMQIMGYMPEIQRIKRMVAEVTPVYDFFVANELTADRKAYFYDAGHFRAVLGEKLKPVLAGGDSSGVGYLLTPETVDAVFEAENADYARWCENNEEYVRVLKRRIEEGQEPKVGDLAPYIGF